MKYFHFIIFLLFSLSFWGQNEQDSIKKEILTIGIGPQVNTFYGEINSNSVSKIFINSRPAVSLDLEKRFGDVIGLQMMLIKGKLADHKYPENFISSFIKSNFNLILNTDSYFDNKHNFSIYSGLGLGIIKYNSSSDSINTNNFDYEYETALSEGITLLAPLTIGFKWKLNPYIQGRVYATYNTLLSDEIDGVLNNQNDSYASLGFTLNYAFHKITRFKKEKFNIDLEKFNLSDEDGDGVIDLQDECHHTPKKVEVDLKGCPKDSDKDGVPDYLDQEPNSKYILHVDEQGRSLTDSLIYYRTHIEDSVEIEKNQTFSIDTVNIDNPTGPNIDTIIPINDSIQIQKIKTDTSSENEMNFIPFQKEFESNYNKKRIVFFISNISSFDLIARKED